MNKLKNKLRAHNEKVVQVKTKVMSKEEQERKEMQLKIEEKME